MKNLFSILLLLSFIATSHAFENFEQAFGQMRHRYNLGHYKRMLAIAPKALEFSKNAKQKYQVLYYKGLALDALQNFWQAEQVFKEAAKIEDVSLEQKLQLAYHYTKSQYANGHFISALANAEKYSEFTDKPSVLHLNILLIGIESAAQLNQNEKALELAEKLAKITVPNSAWHYRGLIMQVRILCVTKNYTQAEQILSAKKLKQIPVAIRSEFFAWQGFCNEKNNRLKLAAKFYTQAYDKHSTYYSGLAALRHANLINRNSKNYAQAAQKYEKVLKLAMAHPRHKSQAIYKIAYIYWQQDKAEKARQYLVQIDDLESPSVYWQAKIYNLHGDILYKFGNVTMARKYFQTCLNLSKDLPNSKLYASDILAQIGKKKVLPAKE